MPRLVYGVPRGGTLPLWHVLEEMPPPPPPAAADIGQPGHGAPVAAPMPKAFGMGQGPGQQPRGAAPAAFGQQGRSAERHGVGQPRWLAGTQPGEPDGYKWLVGDLPEEWPADEVSGHLSKHLKRKGTSTFFLKKGVLKTYTTDRIVFSVV